METLCSNRKGEFKSPSCPGLDILVLPAAEPGKLRSTSMQTPQRQSSIPETASQLDADPAPNDYFSKYRSDRVLWLTPKASQRD
jgi:hypothetical protein